MLIRITKLTQLTNTVKWSFLLGISWNWSHKSCGFSPPLSPLTTIHVSSSLKIFSDVTSSGEAKKIEPAARTRKMH